MTRGFVAAGGRSARMGRDKALLPWGDATLLDHAARRVEAACGSVAILCGSARRYEDRGWPVRQDVVADAGPLGGLLTALGAGGTGNVLLLGVDLPHVPERLLLRLLELGVDADVVAPVLPSGPEPLCAVYGEACRAPVAAAVARGDLKMTSFWNEVRVREVGRAELVSFGDPQFLFRNLNTPDDYGSARDPRER